VRKLAFLFAGIILIGCGGGGGGGEGTNPPPPTWVGVRQISSSTWDQGYSIVGDPSGYIYVLGETQGSIDNNTLMGLTSIYLCKYSPDGNRLWTKYYGATLVTHGSKLYIDSSTNLYIAGSVYGSIDNLASSGSGDVLLIKLDRNGNKIFVKQFGTSGNDRAIDMKIDTTGNIYIAGATSGAFPGFTNNGGSDDIFLAQLDSSGNINWIREFGSPNSDYPLGIVLDGIGGVFMSGYVIPPSTIQGSAVSGDSFLVKYSTVGVPQFIKQYTKGEFVGLQMDSFGNMYTLISNAFSQFIIKLDQLGNIIWERPIVTTSPSGKALTVKNDYIYTVGSARGPLLTNNWSGGADVILLKYDLSGNSLWSAQCGTSLDDIAHGIYVDSSGGIFIIGTTDGAFTGNTNLGSYDAFVLKFDNSGVLQ